LWPVKVIILKEKLRDPSASAKCPYGKRFRSSAPKVYSSSPEVKRPVIGTGRVSWNFQELRGFSEEMRRRGLVPSAKLLGLEMLEPEHEVAEALRLAPRESVYRLKRLRFVNAEPVAVVTSYLPARIFPAIDRQDLENQSLYDVVENTYKRKLQRAEEIIGATKAGEKDAHLLQTETNSALLIIRETTYDEEDVAIEYSLSLLRGDRYTASRHLSSKPIPFFQNDRNPVPPPGEEGNTFLRQHSRR